MTTAADIKAALRRTYAPPSYAILFEVANATGANSRRYADAVAMSLWPSHGLGVTGFEIKVYRGDWRRELAAPEKAETIAAYCDYWYIVTPDDESVIKDADELPPAWGWKVLGADGQIHTKKTAAQTEAKPLDRLFVAALLRNAGKVDGGEVEALVQRRVDEVRAQIDREIERQVEERTRQFQRLKEFRERMASVLGKEELDWFDQSHALAAVAAVHRAGVTNVWGGLATALAAAKDVAEAIDKLHGVLVENGLREPEPKKANRRSAAR